MKDTKHVYGEFESVKFNSRRESFYCDQGVLASGKNTNHPEFLDAKCLCY